MIKTVEMSNNIIEKVVTELISITKKWTSEGNWIFQIEEVRKIAKMNFSEDLLEDFELAILDRQDEVADVQICNNEIDILLWLDSGY